MATVALALLVAALLVSAWHAALWKRVRRIESARSRRIVRALSLLGALVLWLGASILFAHFDLTESGTWFCRVCGRCEERLEVLSLPIFHKSTPPDDSDRGCAHLYQEWFARVVALEHDHDWEPTGCHARGVSTVACYRVGAKRRFFVSLPRSPDEDGARALATKLVRAPLARRMELLDDFQRDDDPANPFTRLERGEALSRAEFEVAYSAWLEWHPLWR